MSEHRGAIHFACTIATRLERGIDPLARVGLAAESDLGELAVDDVHTLSRSENRHPNQHASLIRSACLFEFKACTRQLVRRSIAKRYDMSHSFVVRPLLIDPIGFLLSYASAFAAWLGYRQAISSTEGANADPRRTLTLDLKQISYFTWVYEEKSFSAAARKANVVQPALSMQVRRLEEEFSVKLFERTANGVKPTTAGTRLYQVCLSIMREIAVAKEALRECRIEDDATGPVRVGLPPAISRGILAPVLIEFLELYPNADISIVEAYTGTVNELVHTGRVDFAFGTYPASHAGFMQRLIFSDAVVLLSSQPLNGPSFTPCDLSQMDGLKLILPSANNSFANFVRDCTKNGFIRPAKTMEIDGNVGGFEFTMSSDWSVLSPFVAVAGRVYEGLYIYPVINPIIPFDIYLVYDQRRPLSSLAYRFVEAVQKQLQRVKHVASSHGITRVAFDVQHLQSD
jgi:LysR family nitrogen assimilation transcriptional regulator